MLVLLSGVALAQQVSGKVVNTDNQPIPYATIYLKNTSYGTVATLNGEFSISSPIGSQVLVISSVGYSDLEKKVEVQLTNEYLTVKLNINAASLGEVVVSSDKRDLAKQIITKVRNNRKEFLNNVARYKCNVYSKTSIEYGDPEKNDQTQSDLLNKEKVNFIESYSDLFYTKPNKYKEVKLGYKDLGKRDQSQLVLEFSFQKTDAYERQVTVNNPLLFEPDKNEVDFNFYKGAIDLPSFNENPYPSPIGPTAFVMYNFDLEESFFEGGKKVYKIKVTPKLKNANVFQGFLFIEDETFALIGTELEIPPHSMKFFKYFKLIQRYKEVSSKQYVLLDEEFSYHTNLKGNKSAYGNTLLRYSNYDVSTEISSSFLNHGSIIFEDNAYEKSDTFWNSVRPNTLKPRELSFIHIQDSLSTYKKSAAYFKYLDSLPRKINIWDVTLNGVWLYSREKKRTWFFSSLLNTVHPFAVGGYRQAVSGYWNKEWVKANALKIGYDVNYGFQNKNLKGALSASYTYLPKKFASFRVSGSNSYEMINDYESLTATFSRSNYIDKVEFGAGSVYELLNGVLLDVHAEYGQYTSIDNLELSNWSDDVFGSVNIPKEFQSYKEVLLDVNLTLVPFQKYVMTPHKKLIKGSGYPTFKVNYKKGLNSVLGSDVNYDFLQISAFQEIQLKSFGAFNYKVFAGRFLNNQQIRIADRKYFRGSDELLFSDPLRSFQLLGPSVSTTNNYLQSQFIHHFNGAILNKVPLVNRLRIHTFAGGGALLVKENDFKHAEFYAGLERIVRIRKQLFKFSGAYVVSNSTQTEVSAGFKFGVDFYNSFTNKWSY